MSGRRARLTRAQALSSCPQPSADQTIAKTIAPRGAGVWEVQLPDSAPALLRQRSRQVDPCVVEGSVSGIVSQSKSESVAGRASSGPVCLAQLAPRLMGAVYVKRGSFCIVGIDDGAGEGDKVGLMIDNVVMPEHRRELMRQSLWPAEFNERESSSDDDDDGLPPNPNRRPVLVASDEDD